MIKVNEYLDGKVKSLGFELDGVRYTAGVLSPGNYSFGTEQEEHVTATVGEFRIRLKGRDWALVKQGETIVIPPGTEIEFDVEKTASYVCMYK